LRTCKILEWAHGGYGSDGRANRSARVDRVCREMKIDAKVLGYGAKCGRLNIRVDVFACFVFASTEGGPDYLWDTMRGREGGRWRRGYSLRSATASAGNYRGRLGMYGRSAPPFLGLGSAFCSLDVVPVISPWISRGESIPIPERPHPSTGKRTKRDESFAVETTIALTHLLSLIFCHRVSQRSLSWDVMSALINHIGHSYSYITMMNNHRILC
jgi:hypothetical protein